MAESRITKRYSRKFSYDFSSEEFCTEESRTINYVDKQGYLAEHAKLATQVKTLTVKDLEKHSELLKEAAAAGRLVKTTEETS